MDEIFTQTLNVTINQATVKETDVTDFLDADEVVFYHAIRTDLDLLQRAPQQQIIENILIFSQGLR